MEPEILTKSGLLARGIFALIIGLLCFSLPVGMQAVFSYIIGIFLLVMSLITGGLAISETGTVQWGVFILSIIGILIGILAFISPFAMFFALAILIAAWAIVTGIAELVIAFSLKGLPFRVLLGISGLVAILFGVLIGFAPLPTNGSYILILLVGIYCVIFGILSIITGLLMRKGTALIAA
ncbi:MAG: HdeD family acid-resistance protein [Methanoregula sp.]